MTFILVLFGFLLLVPITLLMLVPLGFALTGFRNLLTLPLQMLQITFDMRRRRNHALEHATVNVLEQRYQARMPVGGFAEPDGFFVQGPVNAQLVLDAAKEGLQRLKAGETELALHPRCGTMIVSGQLISAITFFATLISLGNFSFLNVILSMLFSLFTARLLAQPVGLFLQRTITTSTDVEGMHIDRLDAQMPQNPFTVILSGNIPVQYRIWTHEVRLDAPVTPKRYKAY
jgi:hypothetical protein